MDRIDHPTAVDIGGGRMGFRSKDTVAGVPGTVVTAGHMNAVQEEIMAVIEKAGLAGDGAVLLQLVMAIRSQASNFRAAAGTANALTAALDPVPASYAAILGMPFRFVVSATNNAAASLNLNGLGAQNIVYPGDNTNMLPGELVAGAIRTAMWDGSNFQLIDAGSRARAGIRGMQLFTASGTFTPSTNGLTVLDRLLLLAWGAGGGGSSIMGTWGGAGGGGGLGMKSAACPSGPTAVTVGVGGAGNNAGAPGGNGGGSSFGSLVSATGGTGGASGGSAGGTGSGGDANLPGGQGGDIINDVIASAIGGAAPFMGSLQMNATAGVTPIGSGGWARSNGNDASNGNSGAVLVIW